MQSKIHDSNADVKHSHSIDSHAGDVHPDEYEYQEYPKVVRNAAGEELGEAHSAEEEAALLAPAKEASEEPAGDEGKA